MAQAGETDTLTTSQLAERLGEFHLLSTCDALRGELEAAYPTNPRSLPLRALADELAEGNALTRGAGRAAAVGVSVVLTVSSGRGPALVAGLRRPDLAVDPGRWHVAPSGMLEPGGGGQALLTTVRRELGEELGVELAPGASLEVMGFAHDLLRLRPEVCMRLELPARLGSPPPPRSSRPSSPCRLPISRTS